MHIQAGNTLPVIILQIANPLGPIITTYSTSLKRQDPLVANGHVFVAPALIIYEPEDKTTWTNTKPTGGQDLSGTYYQAHKHNHFIHLLNKGLAIPDHI